MYLASVYTQSSSQRGFTLVELMISMTIGLFLSAGMVALLIGNKQSYRDSENVARVQETGRFAVEYLAKNVRQSGLQNFAGIPPANWPPTNYIQGWPGATSAPSGAILTVGVSGYVKNTDLFRITYYDTNLSSVVTYTYYVSNTSGLPGLREQKTVVNTTTTTNEELLESVYDMQLRYGVDTTGDDQIDNYFNTAPDWNRVLAVKIDLLVGSSEDNLVDAAMSLPFEKNDGTFFTATNRRIYQMFSTTVALRNRMK
ncbi:PilW family protein [Chromatium okenii]|nr:PilW family protein [Chromatium okenii]